MTRGIRKTCHVVDETDRELIELTKTKTLKAIADKLQRSPKSILKRQSGEMTTPAAAPSNASSENISD